MIPLVKPSFCARLAVTACLKKPNGALFPAIILAGTALLASRSGLQADNGTPGNFDFYVLALSWSPGFCETPAAAKTQGQCAAGANLGFVVHGLWPQYDHGFPLECTPAARVPSRV
ncbi:MAG: hypothetical protein J2P49_10975, partial [Methylocapsa sp.]|nr:hypothetical protein [Methylocapsa sp.]